MNRQLAAKLRTELKAGKKTADAVREMSVNDPELARAVDAYVEGLYRTNVLLGQARPWKGNSWEAILGKFSLISLLLWLGQRDRHGPLKAGAAIVVWSLIDSGLRELQRRM